jgi:hypothetical protein
LTRRDREVLDVGELSDADLAAIACAEVPAEYAYLDAELATARPAAAGTKRSAPARGKRRAG